MTSRPVGPVLSRPASAGGPLGSSPRAPIHERVRGGSVLGWLADNTRAILTPWPACGPHLEGPGSLWWAGTGRRRRAPRRAVGPCAVCRRPRPGLVGFTRRGGGRRACISLSGVCVASLVITFAARRHEPMPPVGLNEPPREMRAHQLPSFPAMAVATTVIEHSFPGSHPGDRFALSLD